MKYNQKKKKTELIIPDNLTIIIDGLFINGDLKKN